MNSKEKGSSFERETCKKLSLWITNGEKDSCFWRTQNSGGRFSSRRKKGVETINQDGDITATEKEGEILTDHLSVECKHYKDINLWSLITFTKGQSIYSFWKQAEQQALDADKIPTLICRQNCKPILFATDNRLFLLMKNYFNLNPIMVVRPLNMYIYLFEKDILNLDPVTFRTMLEEIKNG